MNRPAEQAIDEYLDQLSAQLGAMPSEIQQETREELRQHLQFLVARQSTPRQITESALRQFGDPVVIGRRLALEWEEGEWSLSGLPWQQRIAVIREAGAAEIAEVALQPSHFRLKTIDYCQLALLAVGWILSSAAQGTMPGLSLAPSLLMGLSQGAFVLYFALGMIACFLEWKGMGALPADDAPNRRKVLNNLIARAGLSILIPGVFLFPQWVNIFAVALMLMPVLLWATGRYQRTPRSRLVLQTALVYGAVMGILLGATMRGIDTLTHGTALAAYSGWLWLLVMLPFNFFGRWFWKRTAKR
ncbi:hypothetical protein EON80_21645 [bacterium]|nr:MAG: hypothetical protein EON80_21645 [bacterium]